MTPAVASPGDRLRELLNRKEALAVPGAYDALTARLVQHAGFPAVYMTGYGVSASLLGGPDVGLVTLTEMAGRAAELAAAVSAPVIADADTGYGNPLNVRRTVMTYAAAGVAGLHLEDQVTPKRCGHMNGKLLISKDEMVAKIRAAADAAGEHGPVIIARTDARAVTGLDDALDRAAAYAEAGADALFVESPESEEEVARIAEALQPHPLVMNMATGSTADGGKTPPVSFARLEELEYRLVLFPVQILYATAHAAQKVLALLRANPDLTALAAEVDLVGFNEFNSLVGLDDIAHFEQRYATS